MFLTRNNICYTSVADHPPQSRGGARADLGRAGIPTDIGPVICLLASARNTYTTGANVNVDGGSSFFA